jgi:hypothetical protein
MGPVADFRPGARTRVRRTSRLEPEETCGGAGRILILRRRARQRIAVLGQRLPARRCRRNAGRHNLTTVNTRTVFFGGHCAGVMKDGHRRSES